MAPKPRLHDQPVNVRLPREMHAELLARAEEDDRSLAATIRHACRLYLASHQESQP